MHQSSRIIGNALFCDEKDMDKISEKGKIENMNNVDKKGRLSTISYKQYNIWQCQQPFYFNCEVGV